MMITFSTSMNCLLTSTKNPFLKRQKAPLVAVVEKERAMQEVNFDAIKRFIFDLSTFAVFCMALVRMLATEWKKLRRVFRKRRRL